MTAPVWQEIVVNDCFDEEIMEVNTILSRLSQVKIYVSFFKIIEHNLPQNFSLLRVYCRGSSLSENETFLLHI